MTKRQISTSVVVIVLAAGLSACASSDGDAEKPRRAAETVATFEPDEGSALGDVVVRGSTAIVLNKFEDDSGITVFDTGSGAELWSVDELASNTVWVGGDFVVFHVDAKLVEVRELDSGEVRHDMKLKSENLAGKRSSVVGASTSEVFIVEPKGKGDEILLAVDADSGKELWDYRPPDSNDLADVHAEVQPPATGAAMPGESATSLRLTVDAPVVHVTDSSGSGAVALDAKSGKHRWTVDSAANTVWNPDGVISATSNTGEPTTDRTVTSIETDSGRREEVTVHHSIFDAKKKQWRYATDDDPEIQIAEGMVFAQDADHHPLVTDSLTGETVWAAQHAGQPLAFGEGVAIYQGVSDKAKGSVIAVDISTGKQLWKADKIIPDAESTIVDGRLLMADESGMQSTDLRTGKAQWVYKHATLVGRGEDQLLFSEDDARGGDEESTLTVTKLNGRAA